jgi:ABC-type bacteriocin/lantibiotic exporter with double-glycine peptidase domain
MGYIVSFAKSFSIKILILSLALAMCFGVSIQEHSDINLEQNYINRLCGVNCLYLICKYYNVNINYSDLMNVLSPSDQGSSMLMLKKTAENLGFETRAIEISALNIIQFKNPLIALAQKKDKEGLQGHFLVVVPVSSKQGFWVFDPPNKVRWEEVKDADKAAKERRLKLLLLRPKKFVKS